VVSRSDGETTLFGGPFEGGQAERGVGPGIQAAADHLVATQCANGGWNWAVETCAATYYNLNGPIGRGLIDAYGYTSDPTHLAAAVKAGNYELTSTYTNGEYRGSSGSASFLYKLSQTSGNPTYSNWAAVEFFDELTNGTYGPDNRDTAGWIALVQTGRSGSQINLRPWDFAELPWVAGIIGNPDSTTPPDGVSQQTMFLNAVLDGLNTLDRTAPDSVWWDMIGLAGGVQGLALNGTTSFPAINAPKFAPIDGLTTLQALADVLAGYQNADGSWYWSSNLAAPTADDQDTQTTAYAVMALVAADPLVASNYSAQIAKGRDWLRSMQRVDGSFYIAGNYPPDRYPEINGEATGGLAPDPCSENKLVFEVPIDARCVKSGETVTVELWQRNLQVPVRGFQAFAQFDSTALTNTGHTLTTTPYPLSTLNNVTGNNIDLAAGVNYGSPAIQYDALLATLTFTAGAAEGSTVVSFRYHDPVSQFTGAEGQAVPTCLVQSATILIDNTAPVITCPADALVGCDASTHPDDTGYATATDNLDDNPAVTYADSAFTQTDGCTYTGYFTRTWTATDCAGNFSTCMQTITVNDVTPPAITCPADITVPADAGACSATLVPGNLQPFQLWEGNGGYAHLIDVGGTHGAVVEMSSPLGSVSSAAVYARLATPVLFDSISTLSADFNWLAGTYNWGAPRFSLGMDMNGDGVRDGNVFVYWGPNGYAPPPGWQSTGNFIGTTPTYGWGLEQLAAWGGAYGMNWTQAQAVLTGHNVVSINVALDGGGGGITQTMQLDNIVLNQAIFVGAPIVGDNCDPYPALTYARDDGLLLTDPYPVGTTTVTWTVTDCAGNPASCAQTITVTDAEAPVLTCPADATVGCGQLTDPPATGMATAADNCGVASITWVDDRSGLTGCNATGTIVRTWTATDVNGNSASGAQNVVLVDTTPPVLVCPADITVPADAGSCTAVVSYECATATDTCYFEGFEDPQFVAGDWVLAQSVNWNEYNSQLIRVSSGTDGVPSRSGGFHGVIDSTSLPPTPDNYPGIFSRLRGYSSVFGAGFVASVDVYIDLADPAVAAKTYGFDISTAANTPAGDHRRDFVFHAAADDNTAPGHVLIGADNNSNFAKRNDLETINHYELSTTGWYTFEWNFRDYGDGTLAVDLKLYDAAGNWLWTETRHDASDIIGATVGGNRYMWFCFVAADRLPIDDTQLSRNVSPVTCAPPSGATFPPGTTTVTASATDACGNTGTCSFQVTVSGDNELVVTVGLDTSFTGTRCITFELWNCTTLQKETLSEVLEFTNGLASGVTILVPCTKGPFDCITARDTLHTLRTTVTPTVVDAQYVASFTDGDKLLGGNLNDDKWIDILDFGVFSWKYGTKYKDGAEVPGPDVNGNTTCSTGYPHADISGDGLVNTNDFNWIQSNFLKSHEANCCGQPGFRDDASAITRISVDELFAQGLGELAAGDFNGDGWLDEEDMVAFANGTGPVVRTGDLNCDGVVNFGDINPFVQAITSPAAWAETYPGCSVLNADVNEDGVVNFADINPFVTLLQQQ